MSCYKDITFCPFYTECADGEICPRALTPEIFADAKDFGCPICRFIGKPGCFVRIEEEV